MVCIVHTMSADVNRIYPRRHWTASRCVPARRARFTFPRAASTSWCWASAVTADTDLQLSRYFGVSEGIFLGLQGDYDLMERRRQIEAELATIAPRAAE
jgi:hypothetical protein